MENLIRLVATHEEWLMRRVLHYAREHGYARYTSTLAEAWRLSVAGLSQSLIATLRQYGTVPQITPDEELLQDPAANFGVIEAQRHQERGISLAMFLGMLKLYRDSYFDLVRETPIASEQREEALQSVARFFDRTEMGVSVAWSQSESEPRIQKMQETHRELTNEKIRYLTIFESLNVPVLLFDTQQRILNVNHAAAELLGILKLPGATYYSGERVQTALAWLDSELRVFASQNGAHYSFSKDLPTGQGTRHFEVRLQRMLDFSEKYTGTVVMLNDVTDRKRLENMLRSLSLEDALTRVYSWRAFVAFAAKQLELARRQALPGLLLLARADNLGEIAARDGAAQADRALAHLASTLRQTLRACDLLGRYRDNVFAGLLLGCDAPGERALAMRLGSKLGEYTSDRNSFGLEVSLSSAAFDSRQPTALDELLLRADDSSRRTRLDLLTL